MSVDPTPKKTTIYRFLTGPDDSAFCHRISDALSKGWKLHGSPQLAFNAERGIMMCGQAVTKETDKPYVPDMKLGEA
ncbi:MAG: DUF1737 domain-containing protein [Beijerinckiaceae bacterium]